MLQRTEQLNMPKYVVSSITSSRSFKDANPAPSEFFICPICKEKHTSRNQLYKHWRISSDCSNSNEFNYTLTPTTIRPKRIAAALLLGYTENAERCEKVVENYLKSSEKDSIFLREFNNTRVSDKLVITRSSSSSYRMSPFLKQSDEISASGDVLTFSYQATNVSEKWNDPLYVQKWLDESNEILGKEGIKLFSRRQLSETLHAEQHCTIRIYDYILPMKVVLPAGVDNWDDLSSSDQLDIQVKLKHALRLLLTPKPMDRGGYSFRRSKEQLDIREDGSHRWHNFCAGKLSPSDSAAGRSVDKFQLIYDRENNRLNRICHGKEYLLIRVQGDGFLNEQIRRMVGTALAVFKGYLPETFCSFALDGNNIIDTPLAPPRLLYLKQARFGFHTHFRSLFVGEPTCKSEIDALKDSGCNDPIKDVGPSMIYANDLIASMCLSEYSSDDYITNWLLKLKDDCDRIRIRYEQIIDRRLRYKINKPIEVSREVPPVYASVLCLLREADKSGNWPATSQARSKVMNVNDDVSAGSFSIGNTLNGQKVPKGNFLFGELIDAIFELERKISPHRPASTMVAINRRAAFRPHVDAGAGYGQSLSLIVGLGDYEGGEIAVESNEHDIRYKPLEFDGWRERHWTLPFRGERFTLVYFTPATSEQASKLKPLLING